jgi:probable HAF family extracellular repeat protein
MFTQTNIGTLGGTLNTPQGIGPQGEVVGFSTDANGEIRAYFFDTNGIRDLGLLGLAIPPALGGFVMNVSDSRAIGTSPSGAMLVVGTSGFVPNGVLAPFPVLPLEQAYFVNISQTPPGFPVTMVNIGTLLPPLAPGVFIGNSHARAVNNRGQIVGVSDTTATGAPRQAFLFDLSTGSMVNIGTLVTDPLTGAFLGQSEALGINDNGQIVGVSDTSFVDANGAPIRHAFLFEIATGQMQSLGTLIARQFAAGAIIGSSEARAINNRGQIVGVSTSLDATLAVEVERAFLFDASPIGARKMIDLGTHDAANRPALFRDLGASEAFDINENGDIAGSADTALPDPSGARIRHAFKFDTASGQLEDLDAATLINPGFAFTMARGINDVGQICGVVSDVSGAGSSAMLITP